MARKHVLYSWPMIDSVAVSADHTSSATCVEQLDYASIIVSWAASTLSATITVQARNGEHEDWYDLDLGSVPSISGTSGTHHIILDHLPFTHLRIFVDRASGTGTVRAVITSKSNGG